MFSFLAPSKPTLGVVPVTNQFAWGVGMGCAQGSDVIGMRMIGAWNAPSAVRPEWPALPPEVALPMIASANARRQHRHVAGRDDRQQIGVRRQCRAIADDAARMTGVEQHEHPAIFGQLGDLVVKLICRNRRGLEVGGGSGVDAIG